MLELSGVGAFNFHNILCTLCQSGTLENETQNHQVALKYVNDGTSGTVEYPIIVTQYSPGKKIS